MPTIVDQGLNPSEARLTSFEKKALSHTIPRWACKGGLMYRWLVSPSGARSPLRKRGTSGGAGWCWYDVPVRLTSLPGVAANAQGTCASVSQSASCRLHDNLHNMSHICPFSCIAMRLNRRTEQIHKVPLPHLIIAPCKVQAWLTDVRP